MLVLALVAAIVVEDGTVLRASADDRAPRQAELWKGDWLEVRGETDGFYQVWDHRHLRPGYVRPWRVRTYEVGAAAAPDLRAILLYLRDSPGAESLAIAHAALYLKAAPPTEVAPEIHDAIGVAADRLARRASGREAAADPSIAEHVEVARAWGVALAPVVVGETVRVCYDGEAFRMVLATSSDPVTRARAALKLTTDGCLASDTPALAIRAWNDWRSEVLAAAGAAGLPGWLAGELHLRRAEVFAWLAFSRARAGEPEAAREAEEAAVASLALVERTRLLPELRAAYDATAVKVAASRFALDPQVLPELPALALQLTRTEEGGARLSVASRDGKGREGPPGEIATSGILWPSSVRLAPDGRTVVATVQLTPTWSELAVLRRTDTGWTSDPLVPSVDGPESGYVEAAGFTPDGARLLLCREAVVAGRHARTFEVLKLETLSVQRSASTMAALADFRRYASAEWRGATLSSR